MRKLLRRTSRHCWPLNGYAERLIEALTRGASSISLSVSICRRICRARALHITQTGSSIDVSNSQIQRTETLAITLEGSAITDIRGVRLNQGAASAHFATRKARHLQQPDFL